MGKLKKLIRKIIPKEIRDNPLVAVISVVALGPVALGAVGASAASIVGATVAANTATAVALGTGVVTAGITFAQTGDVSDSLKAGVRAGVGSAVGSAVSSSITNAVAGQTGASLADLEPALRELPSQAGIGGSLAGAASITAGNVAGEAARAAITGRPIEEGALLGLAGSIPQSLSMAPEFNSLHPIVQNVVASSAQAAVRGQDIGDAALTALITSSKIVSRAINELPGGQEFIKENPRFTKYIIDSVSSALAAQLQGKDVNESVIQRLVMTTAEIIGQEIENAQESGKLQQAQATYTEAQQKEQQLLDATAKLNNLMQTPENANLIARYNNLNEYLQSVAVENQKAIDLAQAVINNYNSGSLDTSPEGAKQAQFYIDAAVARAKQTQEQYNQALAQVQDIDFKLTRNGFRAQYNELANQIQALNSELTALTNTLQAQASDLAQSSASFFEDLSTEFATTIAPLTAFEDVTDVGDQDVLAEIQPVAPPEDLTQLAQDDALLRQIQEVAARPDVGVPTEATELASATLLPEFVVTPTRGFTRYYRSADGSVQVIEEDGKFYIVTNRVPNEVSAEEANAFLATLPQGSGTVEEANAFLANLPQGGGTPAPEQERSLVEELMLEEMFGGDQGTTDQAGIGFGTEISPVIPGDLTGTTEGAVIGGDTGAETAATTGTPADVGTGAEPVTPTQPAEQPSFSVLFNYLTKGGGSPYAPNKAVFDMEGGLGTAGGGSKETTFKLITINENTGEQTYDVGGKLYTLMLLPSYRKEVLVPKDPSANVVYINTDQFNRPKFVETSIEKVPFPEAEELVKQIEKSEQAGQTAGGAPAGAEGAAGGRTAEEDRIATTEEQLQPGARPEEVAAAPSFPELVSGETEPTMPAPVPGEDAGFEEAIRAPGAGGVEGEITDEDIIRLIQDEIGTPGGGEGEGAPGEEGAGVGEGEEGVGPGAGEEGEGEGAGGEGTGTGEGIGPGTGEGGGEISPTPDILLPTPRITTVSRRGFARAGEAAPYRVTGMDESGILGRKQPLFGGDEDLQRAEWNRRSLRLKRLLGL